MITVCRLFISAGHNFFGHHGQPTGDHPVVEVEQIECIAECSPCLWMDHGLGPGAEPWLRGRGGLRARIFSDGLLRHDPAEP